MTITKHRFLVCLIVCLIAAAFGAVGAVSYAGAEETSDADRQAARTVVERLHETLLSVMKEASTLGYDGRYARLEPQVAEAFDLVFMAEKSAGRYWRDFDEAQRRRWLDTFRRLTIANYAGRFDGYSGQRFETQGVQEAGFDTLLVRTRLVQPKDEDVEINYRLRKVDGQWKVIDIYLSGTVSELALRRAEYSSVLKRDGFDKLVDDLEAKINDLAKGSSG